uniref:Transient receptor potential cation channel subfamily M member 1 n=1 Tax=Talaromyces marneffei PM1 TaxID=1077442 RepID=A0A093VDS7_TALMA
MNELKIEDEKTGGLPVEDRVFDNEEVDGMKYGGEEEEEEEDDDDDDGQEDGEKGEKEGEHEENRFVWLCEYTWFHDAKMLIALLLPNPLDQGHSDSAVAPQKHVQQSHN